MGNRRVAVTGGAAVSSLGITDSEMLSNLEEYKNKVVKMPEWENMTALEPILLPL